MRPTGTVVFLFSDIEGSTARWESRPQAMREALRQHDEIVRSAMETHGGFVFKTIGDAFCVAFGNAAAALAAALDAQRKILAADWSSVGGLRVRVALHAGDADERDGDYFGSAVNRVARLLATAHGAQVVLSGTVADLLNGRMPDDASLRALGTFRLKDLQQPERIYQLVAPDLPGDFKPLRTLEAVPNNLPRQTSPFIGREDDIARIKSLMRDGRVVTIAGAGGVGKTRIALQCAADAIDRMEDGVWFVNLAPISEDSLVAGTVLAAVGGVASGSNALEGLVSHLADREVLLVLDNCEQIIAQAAQVATALCAKCPRVTILATSREALHIDGEQVYRLPPMDVPDAVRLFVQRAQANTHFDLTAANRASVEEICGHLDGIPLAVELAAARLRVLSLEDLLQRLGERFRVLTGGSRTALPRHQTLRALIDWSFELLTEDEKTILRRLSVFNGGCTIDAANGVCSDETLDEWTTVDLLSSLIDKSLVVAGPDDTHRRYHLLETIREYALEKMRGRGDEYCLLEDRHARYFAQIAAKLYSDWDRNPGGSALVHALDELNNFRSALTWTIEERHAPQTGARLAADVAPVFIRLSLLNEGVSWCLRALCAQEELPSETAGRLHYMLSMLHNNQALYPQALSAAQKAVDCYRDTKDGRGLIRALSQIAQQYARAGRFDEAKPNADEAIERARATGDARLFAGVTRRCAFSLPPAEIERARSQFAPAVSTLRSLGAGDEACQLLEWWAEAEAAAECFERAIDLGTQALRCADEIERMHRASNIAGYAIAAGDFDRAEPFTREALHLAVTARHPLLTAIGIAYSSAIVARFDVRDAARLFGYARVQMSAMNWDGIASDRLARENILRRLSGAIVSEELLLLLAEGASWPEERALELALQTSTSAHPFAGVPKP